jgi:dihydroorotase
VTQDAGSDWALAGSQLVLTRPDDWHLHLRDGDVLASVLPDTARRFARAMVMPNLDPPVTTTEQALAYRDRILAALPAGMRFEPLMTLYLTDHTSPEEIVRARASGLMHAVGEAFLVGATTNSADFYGLPRNRDSVTLVKEVWAVPPEIDLGAESLVPLRASETVAWRLVDVRFSVLPA